MEALRKKLRREEGGEEDRKFPPKPTTRAGEFRALTAEEALTIMIRSTLGWPGPDAQPNNAWWSIGLMSFPTYFPKSAKRKPR